METVEEVREKRAQLVSSERVSNKQLGVCIEFIKMLRFSTIHILPSCIVF